MFAESIEPLHNRAVSREWAKSDLIKGLFETKYFKGIFLSQNWPPLVRGLSQMAEEIIEACCHRRDAARLLILRPTHAVPPVDIQVFAVQHILCGHKVSFLHLERRFAFSLIFSLGLTPFLRHYSLVCIFLLFKIWGFTEVIIRILLLFLLFEDKNCFWFFSRIHGVTFRGFVPFICWLMCWVSNSYCVFR